MKTNALAACLVLWTLASFGAPEVANPSFEEDHYTAGPGYAGGNGRVVTGWQWKGSVGVNPYWTKQDQPMAPFADNGRTPDGAQVAVCQQHCRLAQAVDGFEKGKAYVVTYYENARHNDHPKRNPKVEVRLGGDVIVSKHRVTPVDELRSHMLPYAFVTSAVFVAPEDGAFVLEFLVEGESAAALLDLVRIEEVEDEADGK